MNDKLREIANCAPIIKKMTGMDTAIAIWNTDAVVEHYFPAKNFTINFDVGFKDEDPNSKINIALKTGKEQYNKIPKEVFGHAFEGSITPIFDNGVVVGAVTYIFSSGSKDGIIENANSLSVSIAETDKSIESIMTHSTELSSNMSNVQNITDSVSKEVDEAIEVVKTIQQNAKLSNILALNASIESARAGEAGKGFAVVSDEMRKFARMSAEASDKISGSLSHIVKSLSEVKESVNLSKDIAVNQSKSMNELNDIFTDVTEKANKTIEVCRNVNAIY